MRYAFIHAIYVTLLSSTSDDASPVIYFLWPPYAPALVNVGLRKFYTLWTLSVNREVRPTTWIFSWSSLNYRVGQSFLVCSSTQKLQLKMDLCSSKSKFVKF